MSESKINFIKSQIQRESRELVRLSVALYMKQNELEMLDKQLQRELLKQEQKLNK